MNKRYKALFKINLTSIFFIAVSFISVTLAWFAYSGIANIETEIGVKAWNIEITKQGKKESNNVVIPLDDIYPGMDKLSETIKINNLGDSDAIIKYEIESARILDNPLDNYVVGGNVTSDVILDTISHNYPFHINVSLSRNYAVASTGESIFNVSVTWPLDSGNNINDSLWGTRAYDFQLNESKKQNPEPAIKIVLSLTAEQYIENDDVSDTRFNLGDSILFDVTNNERCSTASTTCLSLHVIDSNNKLGDDSVQFIPSINDYTNMNGWVVNTRSLLVDDLLKIVSTDIYNSFKVRSTMSDSVIGSLLLPGRINTDITDVINNNGYYKFLNVKFPYLASNSCIVTSTNYNTGKFALKKSDETTSEIYNELVPTNCIALPVITINKTNL